MCCGCYNNNCYCCNDCCGWQTLPLTSTTGNFYLPSDGSRRQIFTSNAAIANFTLALTNTSSCSIIVELAKISANNVTSRSYIVSPGATSTVSDTNVVNVFVTGVFQNIIPCCSNCINNNCCNFYSGNYTITTTATP